MHLIQLLDPSGARRIAQVNQNQLILLQPFTSTYDLVIQAIETRQPVPALVEASLTSETLSYDDVYAGTSSWRILPSFDHPADPNNCLLSGTGLTHKASAENRQKMHQSQQEDDLTDSMKIYFWGVEGGHPEKGVIGVQPEWFYKGNGSMLKGFGDPLVTPSFADDGGEEPEIAGVYIIDQSGTPWRVGFTTANEFSDHVMERKNYLYLAPSKIRTCAIGPELVVDEKFEEISGTVSIERDGQQIWNKKINTGEKNMAHSLQNLEYHHFKYENHRVPGQVHIHFFGADAFSFGEGISLEDGDIMKVHWESMGRALINPLKTVTEKEQEIPVKSISSI